MPVFFLSDTIDFPPVQFATAEGLLAVGGDLGMERLLLAYKRGIFPWYSDGQPIMWWSPDPRLVLYPGEMKIPRRLKRTVTGGKFQVTMDRVFGEVIRCCASVRRSEEAGTWIVRNMIDAYCALHDAGFAHSVEAWYDGSLAGGLYGVSLGRCFFGESMFTVVSDAAKVAFVELVGYLDRQGFSLIDCQVTTEHLIRFGGREVPRETFLSQLAEALQQPTLQGKWGFPDQPAQPVDSPRVARKSLRYLRQTHCAVDKPVNDG